jgi:hypothetical protein
MGRLKESWLPVTGYVGIYEVSNYGRVRSFTSGAPRIMKLKHKSRGYYRITLYGHNGGPKSRTVHRLVAEAFIPNPENKPQVNHEDGIKTNNKVSNLRWVTPRENIQHAVINCLSPVGERCHLAKLTEKDVRSICGMLDSNLYTLNKIAQDFKVDDSLIGLIDSGKIWNHITGRKSLNRIRRNMRLVPVINCRGEVFKSAAEAARTYGLKHQTHILSVCKGLRKSSGRYEDGIGIKWSYHITVQSKRRSNYDK